MSKEFVSNVCLLGKADKCCRYLTCGVDGFCCEKHSPLKHVIDDRVATNQFTAKGDNCEGWIMRDEAKRREMRAKVLKPRKRLSKQEATETPIPFRDILLDMARTA